jgi:glycosyltransferase involved in cell wall biosynthesis
MKKRILVFAHHIQAAVNPNGYRIQQYFPYFEKSGFEVSHLTTKAGLPALVQALRRADVVYVQRLLPNLVKRRILRTFGKKIIFDFDDAIMYGTSKESATRRRRFGSMTRLSDAVFCGNDFLVSEANKYRKEGVFYVPTVVDTADYPVKEHRLADPPVVGWIGGASTLRYLSDIAPLFASPPGNAVFKIVADKPFAIMGPRTVFERWSGEKEKEMLLSFDIGIMPVRDDIWSRGKCGLKLIQYCAAGLPSLSHPFGVSREIIEEGQSGFLRRDIEEWREAIDRLMHDVALRTRMGRRAREIAEERYSLRVWGPHAAAIADSL